MFWDMQVTTEISKFDAFLPLSSVMDLYNMQLLGPSLVTYPKKCT